MKQLSASKKKKLLVALKKYRKQFLVGKSMELDEAATRSFPMCWDLLALNKLKPNT